MGIWDECLVFSVDGLGFRVKGLGWRARHVVSGMVASVSLVQLARLPIAKFLVVEGSWLRVDG